jgi:hypothetical protein
VVDGQLQATVAQQRGFRGAAVEVRKQRVDDEAGEAPVTDGLEGGRRGFHAQVFGLAAAGERTTGPTTQQLSTVTHPEGPWDPKG